MTEDAENLQCNAEKMQRTQSLIWVSLLGCIAFCSFMVWLHHKFEKVWFAIAELENRKQSVPGEPHILTTVEYNRRFKR